jgi:hypothetical protein
VTEPRSVFCGVWSPNGVVECSKGSGHPPPHQHGSRRWDEFGWVTGDTREPAAPPTTRASSRGVTADEWRQLYEQRDAEFQQARSEADDAQVALRLQKGYRAHVQELQLQLGDAHARVAQLDAQVAEQAAMIGQLRAGKSIGPERSASGGPASTMLSDARHLYSLAGELRAALAPFCGGS